MAERTLDSIAVELKQFSDDEGVDALKAKFDRWIPMLDELAELRVPHVIMALSMVKKIYRMCRSNGAFKEANYVPMTREEYEEWEKKGPCIKVGSNEQGFTIERSGEFVAYMNDENQYYRVIPR